MLTEKDPEIIPYLRNNARCRITMISKSTNIPATTIYDRVKRHAALLDFPKLGFLASAHIAIKVEKDSRKAMQRFLMEKPNINSLYKTNFGTDFLAEAVFRNSAEIQDFTEELEEKFNAKEI